MTWLLKKKASDREVLSLDIDSINDFLYNLAP